MHFIKLHLFTCISLRDYLSKDDPLNARVKSGILFNVFLLLHSVDRNLSLFSPLNVWIQQN